MLTVPEDSPVVLAFFGDSADAVERGGGAVFTTNRTSGMEETPRPVPKLAATQLPFRRIQCLSLGPWHWPAQACLGLGHAFRRRMT